MKEKDKFEVFKIRKRILRNESIMEEMKKNNDLAFYDDLKESTEKLYKTLRKKCKHTHKIVAHVYNEKTQKIEVKYICLICNKQFKKNFNLKSVVNIYDYGFSNDTYEDFINIVKELSKNSNSIESVLAQIKDFTKE